MNIRLFTTLGCHLCEQAMLLIRQLQNSGISLNVKEIEIADSDELMKRYGVRVPVIARPDDDEISWPFSLDELKLFLK